MDMTKTRIAAIVAAATLGAGAFTGATMALAADDTASPNPSANGQQGERGMEGHGGQGERGGHGGPGQRGPREGGPGHLLHSEGVAKDADGNFITVRMQEGEVTAVTAISLSVKSADGYTSTYVLNDATVVERDREDAAPKVGDTVHVRAIVDGTTATAEHVHALSPEKAAELEQLREGMGEGMGEGHGPGHGGPGRGGPGRGGPGHGHDDEDSASAV